MYSQFAKDVFTIESNAISNLSKNLNSNFDDCISLVLKANGRLVICGIGKSGLIGKKIVATLSSTGTPSFFLHPSEAFHGDLGMLKKDDVVLMISYSGETSEILQLVPFLIKSEIQIISMTGNPKSSLAQNSRYHIDVSVEKEACPLNLAPTASTTATLAMGDAIAIALMQARNFKPEDFAQFHPGGSLGKKLLTTVGDVMHKHNLPIVGSNATLTKVIDEMSSGKLGLVIVYEKNEVKGIVTDGDLRRLMKRTGRDSFDLIVSDFMTKNPLRISSNLKLGEAEKLMLAKKISSLLVIDDDEFVGVADFFSVS